MKRVSITLPLYYRLDGWMIYLVWPSRLRRQCRRKGFTEAEVEATVNWYFKKGATA